MLCTVGGGGLAGRPPTQLLTLVWFLCVPVAPDTINNHVKTCREEQKSLHFFAPEYGGGLLWPDWVVVGGVVVSVYPPPF